MRPISRIWQLSSFLIAILVAITSFSGLLNPQTYFKETANWAMQARGQDWGNLIALLFFVPSTLLLSKSNRKSFYVWLGSLIYFIYAYLIYAFFVHFNFLFLLYVSILGLSAYTLMGAIYETKITNAENTASSDKLGAIVLIITGVFFAFLWLSEVIKALVSGTIPASLNNTGLWVNPVQVIDLSTVLPGMILTGVLCLKKHPLGQFFTAPWLIFSALMGTSIIVTLFMDYSTGNKSAIAPIIFVSVIVFASLISCIKFLKHLSK